MGELPADGPEPVETTAALCVWRIFGLTRTWSDRPEGEEGSRQWTVTAGPSEGDQLSLTIGEIPSYITEAIRDWRAQLPYGLNRVFRADYADYTSAQVDEVILSFRESVSMEDLSGEFPLWLTVELQRPITVRADPNARFAWVRDDSVEVERLQEFGESAADYLDGAMVRLLPTLGGDLSPQHLVFAERRPYVLSNGKGAWTLPRLTGGAAEGRAVVSGWDRLPFDALGGALSQLPAGGNAPLAKRLRSARWLWTALEQSSDNLRRLLFAFFGLEVLANQVGQKLRQHVIDTLGQELHGAPVAELLWPVLSDDEAPYRNLVFKFTCLAVVLSRQSAAEDVSLFKKLARARNKFSHGSAEEVDNLPAGEAFGLLQRYLSLVAQAEADGVLPQ